MIVLIYEEIDLLTNFITYFANILQLIDASLLLVHLILDIFRKILLINITKNVVSDITGSIQAILIIIDTSCYHREIQFQHQIGITL